MVFARVFGKSAIEGYLKVHRSPTYLIDSITFEVASWGYNYKGIRRHLHQWPYKRLVFLYIFLRLVCIISVSCNFPWIPLFLLISSVVVHYYLLFSTWYNHYSKQKVGHISEEIWYAPLMTAYGQPICKGKHMALKKWYILSRGDFHISAPCVRPCIWGCTKSWGVIYTHGTPSGFMTHDNFFKSENKWSLNTYIWS